ncbi:MAG: DUF1822 family protein [Thermosynechococcaceae cyanobacterium]
MPLSAETDYLSQVDLLIPAQMSGLRQNMLAETWHVFPTLVKHLSFPVGQRLSRQIYDLLLTVGDGYFELAEQWPLQLDLQRLGLQVGERSATHVDIQRFHRQETVWSMGVRVSLGAYNADPKKVKFVERILEEAKQFEQDWAELGLSRPTHSTAPAKPPTILSRWFQNYVEPEWQRIVNRCELQQMSFGVARSSTDPLLARSECSEAVNRLIEQLAQTKEEVQRQRIVQQLGAIASGSEAAVGEIAHLLHTSLNDETLWTAIEALERLDPNRVASLSQMKTVDLGMQVAGQSVRLVVSLLQKVNHQVSVMLQVYPVGHDFFLPANLTLRFLDATGQVLREVTARQSDVLIQLKLSGSYGESFSVIIGLGDASLTESFVI